MQPVCTSAATKLMPAGTMKQSMARARITPLLLLITDPDARPAIATLSPHREQLPRVRRRQPLSRRERSFPATVCSDWARTLPWFYLRSLRFSTLADRVIALKEERVCLGFVAMAMNYGHLEARRYQFFEDRLWLVFRPDVNLA